MSIALPFEHAFRAALDGDARLRFEGTAASSEQLPRIRVNESRARLQYAALDASGGQRVDRTTGMNINDER